MRKKKAAPSLVPQLCNTHGLRFGKRKEEGETLCLFREGGSRKGRGTEGKHKKLGSTGTIETLDHRGKALSKGGQGLKGRKETFEEWRKSIRSAAQKQL